MNKRIAVIDGYLPSRRTTNYIINLAFPGKMIAVLFRNFEELQGALHNGQRYSLYICDIRFTLPRHMSRSEGTRLIRAYDRQAKILWLLEVMSKEVEDMAKAMRVEYMDRYSTYNVVVAKLRSMLS